MSTYTVTQHQMKDSYNIKPHEYLAYLQHKNKIKYIQNSKSLSYNIKNKIIKYFDNFYDFKNNDVSCIKVNSIEVSVNYKPYIFIKDTTSYTRIINGHDVTSILYFTNDFIPENIPENARSGEHIQYIVC